MYRLMLNDTFAYELQDLSLLVVLETYIEAKKKLAKLDKSLEVRKVDVWMTKEDGKQERLTHGFFSRTTKKDG